MPGMIPSIVKMIFIIKSLPTPLFNATARGGNTRLKIIVKIDIFLNFLVCLKILNLTIRER